jgi:hypothetical protein
MSTKHDFFNIQSMGNRQVDDALNELANLRQHLAELAALTEPKQHVGLSLVYEIAGRCSANGAERAKVKSKLGIKLTIKKNRRKKLFNTLLKAELGVDKAMASRMASCLHWAILKKVAVTDFVEFLERNGGIEGCAKSYRQWKKSRRSPEKGESLQVTLLLTARQLERMRKRKRPFTIKCKWQRIGKELLVRRVGLRKQSS